MMALTQSAQLILQQRRLLAMRTRMAEESYLTVREVAERWGVSRSLVDGLPAEILPFVNLTPHAKRASRRYHPEEVRAAEVRLRQWGQARAEGRAEAYLQQRRAEVARRDAAILARVEVKEL